MLSASIFIHRTAAIVEAAKPCGGLCPVVDAQFSNDMVQVNLDGVLGQPTFGSDQLVLQTVRNHSQICDSRVVNSAIVPIWICPAPLFG